MRLCTTTTTSKLIRGLGRFLRECVVVVVLLFAVFPTTTSEHSIEKGTSALVDH